MGNSWRGRLLRYGMPLLFLGLGLWNLGRLVLVLCR